MRSVVGYVSLPSVDTAGRGRSAARPAGDELDRQRARISDYARRRRWRLAGVFEGEAAAHQPAGVRMPRGLRKALTEINDGAASGLLVDALARISPFSADVGDLLGLLGQRSAILVAIDEQLDTSTKDGQAQADAFLRGAEWERATAGARIRIGHARARTADPGWLVPKHAARIVDRPEILEHIHALRDDGLSLRQIAELLEEEGVPTARGAERWWPTTVASALRYPRPR